MLSSEVEALENHLLLPPNVGSPVHNTIMLCSVHTEWMIVTVSRIKSHLTCNKMLQKNSQMFHIIVSYTTQYSNTVLDILQNHI